MNSLKKKEKIKFENTIEYHMVKARLLMEPSFASTRKLCTFNDEAREINYQTEEITPEYEGNDRTKVLLLFKNPHPDSVAAGLFLSEPHSQAFWERLFEVDYNRNLLPLLNKRDWISSLADTLLTGKYDSPFLYYFRCLYSFPTRQFADLLQLFSGVPFAYRRQILDKSLKELVTYIEKHDIRYIIVFFKDAMSLLGGRAFPASRNVTTDAKKGIDQSLLHSNDSLFWQRNSDFKQKINGCATVYLNMNTRAKNHGTHLPKRYFTYNLEFILKDILKNSPDQNRQ